MKLIEREGSLRALDDFFSMASKIGHAVFLGGQAGVGKTTLIDSFLRSLAGKATVFQGACDSLFTPRPLGPLFDVADHVGSDFLNFVKTEKNRAHLFARFTRELSQHKLPVILVFEDIHWADEATADLIKFLVRRISKFRCLFLLTYRDDEMEASHPVRRLLGDLPPDHFSKLKVNPFSKEAVCRLASEKGYDSGDRLYALTNGNPFYVTEVLAGAQHEIPERVKDAILTAFHGRDKFMQSLLELLSILPSRISPGLVEQIAREYPGGIERCIGAGIILSRHDGLMFKHELYRLTIEEQILPIHRKVLHARVLKMLLNDTSSGELSELIHHAQFAEDHDRIAELAPRAALKAAAVGAHLEAVNLYALAMENTSVTVDSYVALLEHHAYECYLTNQIQKAIASQEEVVRIWRARNVRRKEGDALRFLSRTLWFQGYCDRVDELAMEAVVTLEPEPACREKALAYSNLSQLNMLADNAAGTLEWGQKAIDLGVQLQDAEVLTHAMNNVGGILMKSPETFEEGERKLRESLEIALANGFDEHAARAYTNLVSNLILGMQHDRAHEALNEGMKYCEERNLDSWTYYMMSKKVDLQLRTGNWQEAESIAEWLYADRAQVLIVRISAILGLARLRIRQGKFEVAEALLNEVEPMVTLTGEVQRIVPLLTAWLELNWLRGTELPFTKAYALEKKIKRNIPRPTWLGCELAYWMRKCSLPLQEDVLLTGPVAIEFGNDWRSAAAEWQRLHCPYESALALLEGDEEAKKQSLYHLDAIGATATRDKLRAEMKKMGVKNIPRGARESTKRNPAMLTSRHVDILQLLEGGYHNHEIAEKLFISPKTVDHHVSAILERLDVTSRTKAVSEARRLGILK